ncbi:MAG: DeoR/GlpR family DNA-binding transcription regulator [Anaerovoracaceae bacterium]|jgi:DeoR family myo-inositol catabolism operon transcriptional repressor
MRKVRLFDMEEFINRKGIVTMDEICNEFNIALNTARKDISELVRNGKAEKVYGGVKAVNNTPYNEFLTYERRITINREQKRKVAKKAASFVEDGDIIFLDSGTTTSCIVDFLAGKRVSIITANVEVLINAMKYDNLEVYIIGGRFNKKSCSIVKVMPSDYHINFNINKAFMAASGFSIEGGATHGSPWEYESKRFAMKRASEIFLVIDSTKVDKKTLVKYADAKEMKNIIIDKPLNAKYMDFINENEINLYVAE